MGELVVCELDASEFSHKMFSTLEFSALLCTQLWRKTPVKFRRNVSSDGEEPVIVSKTEPFERLLMEAIERIESTLLPFIPINRPIPFRPESERLRKSTVSLDEISRVFGMADVIALDRLMKQIEKDSEFSRYLDVLFLWIKTKTIVSDCFPRRYQSKRWKLEKSIKQASDVVSAFKVIVAPVLHLLAFVFQYLWYVDRGGSKTYSSGSFDFRANFVSLLLFRAAYFWIKSRQAALDPRCKRKASDALPRGSVYRRSGTGSRYEPRFFLRADEVDEDGIQRLPLGGYATLEEAEIALQAVRFYYGPIGKDGGVVKHENSGFLFSIPAIDAGKKKSTWVSDKVKELVTQTYKELKDYKVDQEFKRLGMTSEMGDGHGAGSSDPSPSAQPVTCSSPAGIAREAGIATESHGGNDDKLGSSDNELIAACFNPGLSHLPPQQSGITANGMRYQEFAPIQGEGVTSGTEHGQEPHFSHGLNFQQGVDPVTETIMDTSGSSLLRSEPSDSVLRQLVDDQKKQIQNYALQYVEFDHQTKVNQIQILELQQEKELSERENERLRQEIERLRQENERLKSKLEQVAKISS